MPAEERGDVGQALPSETIEAQSTRTNNADLLARSGAVADERRVHGQAGAEHRRGVLRLESLRDGEDVALVNADGSRVTASGLVTVLVLGVVGVDPLGAVVLLNKAKGSSQLWPCAAEEWLDGRCRSCTSCS